MEINQIFVNIIGIGIILLIYVFFFGKKEEGSFVDNEILITVQGGYNPSVIKAGKDKPITLSFLRTDNNSCLEEVVLPEYKKKMYLPLNEKVSVGVIPKKDSEFYCGMNMFRGKIDVSGK